MNEFSFLCSHSASLEVYQSARVLPSLTVAHGCGATTSSAMVGTVVVATFDAWYNFQMVSTLPLSAYARSTVQHATMYWGRDHFLISVHLIDFVHKVSHFQHCIALHPSLIPSRHAPFPVPFFGYTKGWRRAYIYMLRTDCKPDRYINGLPVYKPVSQFVIRLACFW